MKIKFENFANAGNGTVDLKDLTVIYGPNNSGKTYVNYAIFSILENLRSFFRVDFQGKEFNKLIKNLKTKGAVEFDLSIIFSKLEKYISEIERKVNSSVHEFFSLPEHFFSDSKISLEFEGINLENKGEFSFNFSEEKIFGEYIFNKNTKKILMSKKSEKNADFENHQFEKVLIEIFENIIFDTIFGKFAYSPYAITSERTGISMFYKLFENRNNEIVDLIGNAKKEEGIFSVVRDMKSVHALPIQRNIELIRFFENISKQKSFIAEDPKKHRGLLDLHSRLLNGGYFISENGAVYFKSIDTEENCFPIPLHATSSSLKSLFSLDVFIKHVATNRHILIIDEPELNLHPEDQELIARLLAKLINCDVKVLVTTHSDYFVRELNNLIKLNKAQKKYKESVMNEFGYEEDEILDYKRVSAYQTTINQKLETVPVTKFGINSEMFDEIIKIDNKKKQDVQLIMFK